MEKYRNKSGYLNLEGRKRIQELLEQGLYINEIAPIVGFAFQTIYSEVRRNSCNEKYDAVEAQRLSDERIKHGRKKTSEHTRVNNKKRPAMFDSRCRKIEDEVESLKTIIQTLSTLIEELYDTINNKL